MWLKFHDHNFNRFWRIHPFDGHTDGRAIAYSELKHAISYMLARAKNYMNRVVSRKPRDAACFAYAQ